MTNTTSKITPAALAALNAAKAALARGAGKKVIVAEAFRAMVNPVKVASHLESVASSTSWVEANAALARMGQAGQLLKEPSEFLSAVGVAEVVEQGATSNVEMLGKFHFPGVYGNWGLPNVKAVAEILLG